MSRPVGIYIHVPLCMRKCPYCDFYSLAYSDSLADNYTDALVRAIKRQPFGATAADTIYFGGGTPALLGPQRLQQVLAALDNAFGIAAGAQITLETNPAATTAAALRELRTTGFNRLSVGVQSLHNNELKALGRLHTAEQARRAIFDAAGAGFADISADLMLAIPGQTQESLAESIGALCNLPVTHISAYLLKIEDGTPFHKKKDALALPDDDDAADRYLCCVQLLEQRGFAQYEISNFAHGDKWSRHNLKYWRCEPYIGIGPAAHSCFGGRRFFFPRDLAAFVAADDPFSLTVPDGDGGGAQEQILLRLRLNEGLIPGDFLPPAVAAALLQKARQLATHGLATIQDGRVALSPQGFLLSNTIIAALLAAAEEAMAC